MSIRHDLESIQPDADLKSAYDQLCASYHAIDDFRTKLLGFLPLAAGTGIFLLVRRAEELDVVTPHLPAMGAFGFAVTFGLFVFEIFGIAKCAALIWTGQDLEQEMGFAPVGQFTSRPDPVFGIANEPFASGVIYPAVLAAWTYVALFFSWRSAALPCAVAAFGIGFAVVVEFERRLRSEGEVKTKERKARANAARGAATHVAAPRAASRAEEMRSADSARAPTLQ